MDGLAGAKMHPTERVAEVAGPALARHVQQHESKMKIDAGTSTLALLFVVRREWRARPNLNDCFFEK